MSSISNNKKIPSRSPSVTVSTRAPSVKSTGVQTDTQLEDGIGGIAPAISRTRSVSPSPQRGRSRAVTQLSSSSRESSVASSIAEEPTFSAEVRDAIDEAKTKPFAQLVREATTTTSGARGVMKVMTYIGLGISLGLLFAHQPFAVVLVAPAFTLLGLGIASVMRSFLNNSHNPSLEAFKEVMAERLQNPSAEDAKDPDFAQAVKTYNFLTQSFANLGKAHLLEGVTKLQDKLAALQTPPAQEPAATSSRASISDISDAGEKEDSDAPQATGSELNRASTSKTFVTAKETSGNTSDIENDSEGEGVLVEAQDATEQTTPQEEGKAAA